MEAVRKVNEIGRHFIADFKLPKSAHSKDEAKEKDANENELLDEISEIVDIGKPTIRECYH